MFLELSSFFHDPADVGNLISGSSDFSKTNLNIRKFMVHVLLKAGLENVEHYFTSIWDECNCAVVWTFFCISFLWDWNENWPFPILWPLLSFQNFLAYWVQHFHIIIFQEPSQSTKGSEILACKLKNDRMILVCFQDKSFNIRLIQNYATNSWCWRIWSWSDLWRSTTPSRTYPPPLQISFSS